MRTVILFIILALQLAYSNVSAQKQKIDLSGEWMIKLDPDDIGQKEHWGKFLFDEQITLPGSLQEQGYGNDVGVDTKWTGAVHDQSWYDSPRYEKYRQPGNIKVPFWLNPEKHYVGIAWYSKSIKIPRSWRKKVVELELERTHWETTLYVDGVEVGHLDGLSTPHRYMIGKLKPGMHNIVLRVDNRVNINVGTNAHSVSDHTQSNWNGVVGNLSLKAKPTLHIDNVQIYPDAKNKRVKIDIDLKGDSGSGKGKLFLQLETIEGNLIGKKVASKFALGDDEISLTVDLDIDDEIKLWSEHNPNLYRLRTKIVTPKGRDDRLTQFGFRDIKVDDTRFYVNDEPIFLRGTLECCIFPLTGYPATDNSYWEKIYGQCKEFGLNHVRFHSWCPPKAAFNVADSMGIYLQVECGGWTAVGDGGYSDEWFYHEGDRILKEYGNHPSFCLMAYGNEPGGGNQVEYLSDLVAYWQENDGRRLYTGGAGWPYVDNANFWNTPNPRIQAWGMELNSVINAQPPRSDYDYRDFLAETMPTISHEIGQRCVYPNFDEIEKYTGVLKAKNFEIFRETLNENNMGHLAKDFLYASGRLQTLCYKAEIEAALRTPKLAGFQLLDLHDFPGQGTALIGVLDAFWDTKGYVEGEEYRMFCDQTVPLVRFSKMIFKNSERMVAPLEFAHFGKDPIVDAEIVWKIITKEDKIIDSGSFNKTLPLDNCISIGDIETSFEQIHEPVQLTVAVEIPETSIRNEWNIWVYPEQKKHLDNEPYITSTFDNSVIERLNNGENVLLLSPKGRVAPDKGGEVAVGFSSIFWNTAWSGNQKPHTLGVLCDPIHPALTLFPNEGHSDFQWWDIVSDCDAMVMDDFPADFKPIVYLIDDWFKNRRLGLLFEAKVGAGKLMVCSSSLNREPSQYPAAAQFKQSILEYMTSEKFNPIQELQSERITELFLED